MTDIATARAAFARDIAQATTAVAAYDALYAFVAALVPARLFTVSESDMETMIARRAYTNNHDAYPVSGEKKINPDRFWQRIHVEQETYVENDIANDKEHFFDYDLIVSLGCEAAMNMPIILGGKVEGTINILDAKNSYTPEIVALLETEVRIAAMLAFKIAKSV